MAQGHGFTDIKDIYNFPDDLATALGQVLYPVGSIYFSTTNTNPNTWIKGTQWELWGGGRVPVGVTANVPDYNAPGKMGGSERGNVTVSLSERNMPAHAHGMTGNHHHSVPTLNQGSASDCFLALYPDGALEICYDPDNAGPAGAQRRHRIATPNFPAHQPPDDTNASGLSVTWGRTHDDASIVSSNNQYPDVSTETKGGSAPFNIDVRQAYVTCYMWKRVS